MSSSMGSVAVLGAGAMGAMYASHFADNGFDVRLVASGERARRLRRDGLTVNGVPLRARVFDPADQAHPDPVDLVLVAVKHRHLAGALQDVAPLVAAGTTFLSVMNGLDSEAVIADRFDPGQVLLAIALGMDAMRVDNRISFRQVGRIEFGQADNTEPSDRVRAVQDALDRAGLAWVTPVDMRRAMWWKFMVNVGINQATAVFRTGYGGFQQEGNPRRLMMALIDEVLAVAAAEQVGLDATDVARWDAVLAGQPADGQTSMQQDVLAGRPTEVDVLAGKVVQLGHRHAVPTPYNQAMVWLLDPGGEDQDSWRASSTAQ